MQRKYLRRRGHTIQWFPHWIQSRCRRCGAWLQELPTRERVTDDQRWQLIWTCPVCAFEEHVRSGDPLETFRQDADAAIEPPGTMPSWSDWRLPSRLVRNLCHVAERYAIAVPGDELEGLSSVLDHDGLHRAPWGTFVGGQEDPTGLRLWLARLRHAPKPVTGATLVRLIAERAVLAAGAVFEELARELPRAVYLAQSHATAKSEMDRVLAVPFLLPSDLDSGTRVGPVIGHGRSAVPERYEDWLLANGAHPWFGHRNTGIRRAPIPADTEFAASCIELADVILGSLDLLHNADTSLQLTGDVARMQTLMGEWRCLQMGVWDTDWRWHRHWPKLPDSFWLRRWDQPLG